MSATHPDRRGPEDPEIEELAAEYALGTLDALERAAVSARLDVDPALGEAVSRWETRLAPLALGVADAPPPAGVWSAIERRLDAAGAGGRPTLHVVREAVSTPEEAPPGGWRLFAIAATLAAVALGGLFVRERLVGREAPMEPLVAILSADGKAPAFMVSVDVARRELTVRRVGAEGSPDHSHELWLVSDKVGKPVSLGLVGREPSTAALARYDAPTFEGATYAISLEPRGGSKTGQPTGPVVFSGKLEPLPGAARPRP